MADAALYIPRRMAIRLLHEAQVSPESEVCGLVGADAGGPRSLYPVRNVAADAGRRFELDPAQQIAAMKAMRERGERLWAVYHSHPAAPPAPSGHDRAGWSYPDAYQLIVSLDVKGVLDLRCWEWADGRPRERILKVLENT
ncbi:MAG: M67 family metallopeptidase [Gammaproteobacteria bacterium]|nr:M67 family metallopeptidase [Gammaproteobacteria bacterium]